MGCHFIFVHIGDSDSLKTPVEGPEIGRHSRSGLQAEVLRSYSRVPNRNAAVAGHFSEVPS